MFHKLFIIAVILSVSLAEEDSCPNIILRTQWNAKKSVSDNFLIPPLEYVVIHHTVTPECRSQSSCSSQMQNIQSYHMDSLEWHDIGYSFTIGGDGNVYEGVGWYKEGAHTYGYNKKGLGVAFIGNFQNKKANDEMIKAAHNLIKCGKADGYLRNDVKVVGARQVVNIISPGDQLYHQIQKWPEWSSRS